MRKMRQYLKSILFLAPLLALVPWSLAVTAESPQAIQAPVIESYSYDSAGRLLQVRYGDGPAINYSYDANGNILSVRVLPGDRMFEDGFEQ